MTSTVTSISLSDLLLYIGGSAAIGFVLGYSTGFSSASGKKLVPGTTGRNQVVATGLKRRAFFITGVVGSAAGLYFYGPPHIRNLTRDSALCGYGAGGLVTLLLYRSCAKSIQRQETTKGLPPHEAMSQRWSSFWWSVENGFISGTTVMFVVFLGALLWGRQQRVDDVLHGRWPEQGRSTFRTPEFRISN